MSDSLLSDNSLSIRSRLSHLGRYIVVLPKQKLTKSYTVGPPKRAVRSSSRTSREWRCRSSMHLRGPGLSSPPAWRLEASHPFCMGGQNRPGRRYPAGYGTAPVRPERGSRPGDSLLGSTRELGCRSRRPALSARHPPVASLILVATICIYFFMNIIIFDSRYFGPTPPSDQFTFLFTASCHFAA